MKRILDAALRSTDPERATYRPLSHAEKMEFKVDNSLDVDVDVELEAARPHDWDFNRTLVVDSMTLSSGAGGAITTTAEWPLLRLSVTPSMSPSSGDVTAHAKIIEE